MKSVEAGVREGFRSLIAPLAIRSLQRAAADCQDLDAWVALVFKFRFWGIRIAPLQVRSEITALLALLARDPPRTLLEIGTAKGGTFFLFSRVAAADATLVSVDLPQGAFGAGYARWRTRLYRSFARDRQRVELLRADSHAAATVERVRRLLRGHPIDFLFIDGDHRYEGVRQDYEVYSSFVREGGLIGFHDIVPGPARGVGGVPLFWAELKPNHAIHEFVADWNQQAAGIGVCRQRAAPSVDTRDHSLPRRFSPGPADPASNRR